MKNEIILKASIRELKGGSEIKKGLKSKKIPAVAYGNKMENENLCVDALAFSDVFKEAGENTIIKLDVDGGKPENVLIYDYQIDPLTDEFIHIDFLRVDMSKEIEADVPLAFVGESPAVKELGGTLVKNVDTVTVKSLPDKIPSEIEVDLSKLKTFDDHYKAGDLKVGEGVEIMVGDDVVIALVAEPRSEEDLAKLDEKVEEDVSQVEGAQEEAEESSDDASSENKDSSEEKKEEK